jgi:hypothetical protein
MSDWSRRDQPTPTPPERQEAREPAAGAGSPQGTDTERRGDATMTAAPTKGSSERTTPVRGPEGDSKRRESRSGGTNWAAVLAALVLGLLLGGFAMTLVGDDADDAGGGDQFAGAIDEARYQAVILSNDKVYFGKIEEVSDEFYRLDDAFFLRETRASAEAEPERALLPINREIHAPENSMLIRKDEVVLVENLADDSPIQTEIERQLGDE